jgi:hypothetical protein
MRFCWPAQCYLLKSLESPPPPVGLNEDPNIYSCRWGGGGVKDLYSELINLKVMEDIACSSARHQGGGNGGGGGGSLFFATLSDAVRISE